MSSVSFSLTSCLEKYLDKAVTFFEQSDHPLSDSCGKLAYVSTLVTAIPVATIDFYTGWAQAGFQMLQGLDYQGALQTLKKRCIHSPMQKGTFVTVGVTSFILSRGDWKQSFEKAKGAVSDSREIHSTCEWMQTRFSHLEQSQTRLCVAAHVWIPTTIITDLAVGGPAAFFQLLKGLHYDQALTTLKQKCLIAPIQGGIFVIVGSHASFIKQEDWKASYTKVKTLIQEILNFFEVESVDLNSSEVESIYETPNSSPRSCRTPVRTPDGSPKVFQFDFDIDWQKAAKVLKEE